MLKYNLKGVIFLKKVILAPDSFKGTMSAITICNIMEQSVKEQFPDCEIIKIPVADGGEGTIDCFLSALPGEKVYKEVSNPYFEKIAGYYALINNGHTAVIEMAVAAGLPLVEGRLNPSLTTTLGVGELILDAIKKDAKEIIIGLGGSSTNDAGCGALAAMGVKFFDKEQKQFIPTGGSLIDIERIDDSALADLHSGVKITVMCDIENPLFGENGAAFVFAPQKGASPEEVVQLDQGLKNFADKSEKIGISKVQGGGAAGGMGAGLYAFLNAELKSGIDTVLEITGFKEKLSGCDAVFTGEGKIDSQSLQGKVISGVTKAAKKAGVPVYVLAGKIGEGIDEIFEMGVTEVICINKNPIPFEIAKLHSEENLKNTMDETLRLF